MSAWNGKSLATRTNTTADDSVPDSAGPSGSRVDVVGSGGSASSTSTIAAGQHAAGASGTSVTPAGTVTGGTASPDTNTVRMTVVLDAGAIIRSGNGASLWNRFGGGSGDVLGTEFVTVPDVVNEIRDEKARATMATLPFQIHQRVPSQEAMRAVVEFARRTGDLGALSTTDLRVLALSRQLDVERRGAGSADHLRLQPAPAVAVRADRHTLDPLSTFTAGAGAPDEDGEGAWITPTNVGAVTKQLLRSARTDDDGGDGSDADARATSGSVEGQQRPRVVCVTTDFAMQNVVVQMGMELATPDGQTIRSVRMWALKCFACFKLVKDTGRMFCPACGNNTLRKIAVKVEDGGQLLELHSRKPRPPPIRGTRYSMPMPKGGREKKLIIMEDQLVDAHGFVRATRTPGAARGAKAYADDPDYQFGGTRQQHRRHGGGVRSDVVVGHGRRNPNSAKKKFGKANKARTRHLS